MGKHRQRGGGEKTAKNFEILMENKGKRRMGSEGTLEQHR